MFAYAIVLDERMEWLVLFANEEQAREALRMKLAEDFGVRSKLSSKELFSESYELEDSYGKYKLTAYIHAVE